MPKLTTRQTEVLAFIREYRRRNAISPTYREIANHFGWCGPNAVVGHIKALVRKGRLSMMTGVSRSMRLVQHEGRVCRHCGQPV